METVRTDVMVIGGGAAGIRAAVAAREAGAKVMVADKGQVGYSGSSYYFLNQAWGYQVVLPDDPREAYDGLAYEIDSVGGGMNPRMVQILVEEAWPRLLELIQWGAVLRRSGDSLVRVSGCFGTRRQAVCVENHRAVFRRLAARLTCLNKWRANRLLIHEGRCVGVEGISRSGMVERVLAGAVILATGGAAGLFPRSLTDPGNLGEGYAMAHAAGAELSGLEFFQWILARNGRRYPTFFPLGEISTGGAVPLGRLERELRDLIPSNVSSMEVFEARTRHFPFTSRDVSRFVDIAVANTRRPRFLLNHDHGRSAREAIKRGQDGHSDLRGACGRDQMLGVFHAAHAFNGGVVIDEWGRTNIEGLYAAGEVAGGVHGADRLGGTMIPACLVFGKRSGEDAGRYARHKHVEARNTAAPSRAVERLSSNVERRAPFARGRTSRADRLVLERLRNIMATAAGVVRSERDLKEGLNALAEISHEMVRGGGMKREIGAWNDSIHLSIAASELILKAALNRKESRGAHYRSDAWNPIP